MRVLALFFALQIPAGAALSVSMEWDVRTTGSDNNGGAFKKGASGTDFSQQDAAQQAYTDIVIGGTTTQLTSAAHPFAASSVGNIINITGGTGCTTGRYEVVSIATNTITMDRSVGTAASTCTGNLGGSLQTIATAFGAMVANNIVHVKSGTYTQTTTLTGVCSMGLNGFATTHYDNGTAPLITTATNSTVLYKLGTGGSCQWLVNNVNFSNTASVRDKGLVGNGSGGAGRVNNVVITRSTLDGFTNALEDTSGLGLSLEYVELKNGTIAINAGNTTAISCWSCYIHDFTSASGAVQVAFANNPATFSFMNSVISANNVGIAAYQNLFMLNSSVANNSGDGVAISIGNIFSSNTIYYGNGGKGINVSGFVAGWPATGGGCNNAFGSNTGGNYSSGIAGFGEITLTASPFTSSTNFTLNSTAGGGAALKAAGCVTSITGSTNSAKVDVGAIQTAPATGGGNTGFAH